MLHATTLTGCTSRFLRYPGRQTAEIALRNSWPPWTPRSVHPVVDQPTALFPARGASVRADAPWVSDTLTP